MLYVFHVEAGQMINLRITLTGESVESLKSEIEAVSGIPAEDQVLLVSGGVDLKPSCIVASYGAGTDTNPIFLFSRSSEAAFKDSYDHYDYPDLGTKFREYTVLQPSITTVKKRTQLAQEFLDVDKKLVGALKEVVHNQHLQHQGWTTVVANLEDLSAELKKRWEYYQCVFQTYCEERDYYLEFLSCFKNDLLILEKIPVLPALMESEEIKVPDSSSEEKTKDNITLLQWICQSDDFLEPLYNTCSKELKQTDENTYILLKHEVDLILEKAKNDQLKEIGGLDSRLFSLEEFKSEAKIIMQEQEDLAQSFHRNHLRASEVKEVSILPDLCKTHAQQLTVMMNNHLKLREIMRKCTAAKHELTGNLLHRLKWIVYMQQTLSESDNKLTYNVENILALQKNLEVLNQVHRAPRLYYSAVAEVVRRKTFSQNFLLWASDVACHIMTIHNEEVRRRKEFQSQIQGHFLRSLFRGMDDQPPTFATQAPSVFDSNLPMISQEDVNKLQDIVPELAENLNLSVSSTAINFFLKGSKDDKVNEDRIVEEKILEVVTTAGFSSNMDQNLVKAIDGESSTTPHGLPHLKDLDKGCESETDTEEFEKVGQSPFDFDKALHSPRPTGKTQDVGTSTEDDLQISRSEYEQLKDYFLKVYCLAKITISQMRNELMEIKNQFYHSKTSFNEDHSSLASAINDLITEMNNRENETIHKLIADHELEISDFRKISQGKNEEIKSLQGEIEKFKKKVSKVNEENSQLRKEFEENLEIKHKIIEDLEKKLDLQVEKQKCIKEVADRLKCEHRAEIENIRARFKLMTMERSPSENSLEKIERGEYSSLTNHETLLLQIKENFESEKEVAVSDAIFKEGEKWQRILNEKIKEMENKFNEEKLSIIQQTEERLKEAKEQIQTLLADNNILKSENLEHRTKIQQLTEIKEECNYEELEAHYAIVAIQKMKLENELEKLKASKSAEMAASVTVVEGTSDTATSPVKWKRKSESSSRTGKLCTDSCRIGDLILIVWDPDFQNFKILQDGPSLYFLNADSMEGLGLQLVNGQPNKFYCYGEVTEKEYCHARKPVNRFRVPQGTKFFRVKAKLPSSFRETTPTIQASPQPMSQSQTIPATEISTAESSSSVPSTPSKIDWNRSESTQSTVIIEEKGEDSITMESSENVEKATELTENFNVETHTSIER